MTSQTSGGLIKFSTAWAPELLRRVEQLAARRHASRNSVLNYLVERGMEIEEAEQAELERLRASATKKANEDAA